METKEAELDFDDEYIDTFKDATTPRIQLTRNQESMSSFPDEEPPDEGCAKQPKIRLNLKEITRPYLYSPELNIDKL